MNSQLSKQMLNETPETSVKVGPRLHQDIMRAVRLAKPDATTRQLKWAAPAWAAGAAMLAFVFINMTQTAPENLARPASVPTTVVQAQETSAAVSLMMLGDKLAMLSEQSLVPEKELNEELERLKSDLQRFGFRS